MELRAQALSVGWGKRPLLERLDLSVSSGQMVCLLGSNGCGKTTLFRTLLGLMPPMGGAVYIDGRPTASMSRAALAKLLAYVPQHHTPPFDFRVLDVVAMGRTVYMKGTGQPGRADYDAAANALERLGMEYLSQRIYTRLSGGERQMVLIARAVAQQAGILLLDEPTSSLDFGNQARVLRTLVRLTEQGFGVMMTTHAPDQALLCGAQALLIGPGGSVISGPAGEILTPQTLERAYGVPVAVVRHEWDGQTLVFCQGLVHTKNLSERGNEQ